MKRLRRLFVKHEKIAVIILFLLLSTIFLLSWLHLRGYTTGYDSSYHVLTVNGLIHSSDGKIIPGMYDDMGYGEGIFYPQLSHHIGALTLRVISPFGLSALTAMKMSYILILAISGITMYWFMKKITKGKIAPALVSSIFYMLTPYHLSCIIRRDAMAETAIYMFLPIVLWSLCYLREKNNRRFLGLFVIGVVGCLNTHLVMTVFFAIICALYVVADRKALLNKKNIAMVLLGCFLALVISSPFLAPLLQHKIRGGYQVFEPGYMYNDGYADNCAHISVRDIVLPVANANDGIHYTVDLVVVSVCIYTLVVQRKIKSKEQRRLVIFCLITIVALCFLMVGVISIRYWPSMLQLIQFAWRLSTFVSLLLAIALGVCLSYQRTDVGKIIVVTVLVSIAVNAFNVFPKNQGIVYSVDEFKKWGHNYDYLPARAFKNRKEFIGRNGAILIISQNKNAEIDNIQNDTSSLIFDVQTDGKVSIEMPKFYYEGYEIKYRYDDGSEKDGDIYESNVGLIAFDIDRSAHVELKYTGGAVLLISRLASGVAVVCLGGCYVTARLRKNMTKGK